MRNLLLFILFFVSGCGSSILNEKEIDFLIQGQVNSFVVRCQLEGICGYEYLRLASVTFEDIEEENILGVCYTYKNGDRRIVLENSLKNSDRLEAVLYHELGHCLMNLPHVDDYKDIMNTYILSTEYYTENKERLLNEMFERGKKSSMLPWPIGKILQKSRQGNCNHTH